MSTDKECQANRNLRKTGGYTINQIEKDFSIKKFVIKKDIL